MANTNPIFTNAPDIQWGSADGNGGTAGPLKTANTALDGTGTVLTVFTADATNGGFVRFLRARSIGTNSSASVLRIFINNGSTNATVANNTLYDEISLPTTTGSNSQALVPIEVPLGIALNPGFKINCTLGTTVGGGWQITVVGGKY